jgi:septal ring-binding cell division protein DamX
MSRIADAGRLALDDMPTAMNRLAAQVQARTASGQQAADAATAQQAAEAAAIQREAEAAAARAAAEQEAAARRAAEEAAAAQAVIDAEGGCPPGWSFDEVQGCYDPADDPFVAGGPESADLEVRCSNGTATIEECFGPGSDLNGNGIADVNE